MIISAASISAMIKQTLLFSTPVYLAVKNQQLVIDTRSNKGVVTRPIEDIGLIVIESHAVTLTSALLAALMENNVSVVVCDSKHLPSAIMLPLAGNTLLTERTAAQLRASQPLKKQLWQQTVIYKIQNQGAILKDCNPKDSSCMKEMAKIVKSGDPDNIEARAAVFYWKNLFPKNPDFMRGDEENELNSLLNYGYAILRAIIARALVGAGLIPHVGIFHHNKYNAYCLADDIMEPYRPYVDNLVWHLSESYDISEGLTTELKRRLLEIPVLDVTIGRVKRPLMVAAEITAASLARCYTGELRKISYPEIK